MSRTVGFALPGAEAIDAAGALEMLELAADAGLDPLLSTEVCGVSATSIAAALAARRPGLRTGTAIVPLASRSEAALAMEAATAAQIAGGRFLLGVGTSTRQIVTGWHAQPYDPSLATTRRRLRTLRGLLRGDRQGSFRLLVPPGDDVRILLAALGPRMTELALRDADGVILNFTPPGDVPTAPDGGRVFAFCPVIASADGASRARRDLVSYMVAEPYARHFARLGFDAVVDTVHGLHRGGRLRDAPEAVPQRMLDVCYATPGGVAARISDYQRVGAVPIVVPVVGDDPRSEITALLRAAPWRAAG